ncbi:MAG: 4Fe-4S dicluster domain-containing protein [Chloroflexota bacterium]
MGLVLPEVNGDKCGGCGDCVKLCPGHAVELVEGKAVIVRPEDCDYCAECEAFCTSSAIKCPFEIVLGAGETTA